MRKYILLLSMFAYVFAYGHTNTEISSPEALKDTLPIIPGNLNYVYARSMQNENGSEYIDEVQLYDGLGRELERARSGLNPMGKFMVSLQEYDSLGRKDKNWLPVFSLQAFSTPEIIKKTPLWLYGGDKRVFSQNKYESSPLNRVIEQYGPGEAWTNHPVRTEYITNTTSGSLRCSFYYIDVSNALVSRGDYTPGELNVTKVTDEDENVTYTFVDKQGHTILVRKLNGTELIDTYYVYDNKERLRYVLPPMVNGDISLKKLDLYAYKYTYNSYGNCVEKKQPGRALIRYVYDQANRIILSQDGNQATKNEWTFTGYDYLGREALSAICVLPVAPSFDFAIVKASRTSANGGVLGSGYTIESFSYPLSTLLRANYYDDYNFTTDTQLAFRFDVAGSEKYGSQYVNPTNASVSARGMLTGTKIGVLGKSQFLTSSFYYDDKQRMVQSRSQNQTGGYEIEYSSFSFSGKVLSKMHTHRLKGEPIVTQVYNYAYNKLGDIVSITHKANNAPVATTLLEYTYDDAGRIQFKDPGHLGYYTLYTYNIRDQIVKASSPFFTQQLFYQDGVGVPCYNGNISSTTWKAFGDSISRGYRFNYDHLGRMNDAIYGEGTDLTLNPNCYSEQVTGYDKQGNILGLKRFGKTSKAAYGLIDSLSLSYDGNRLRAVADGAASSAYDNGFEFKDGAKATEEYFYDANGNLTKDLNKKIADIQYNFLNLPDRILFEDGSTISYLYDAAGTKLRVERKVAGKTTTADYYGNIVYEGITPKMLFPGIGYYTFTNGQEYHYFIQDYQGNNRVVADRSRTIEEVNHYYPFGGSFANTSSVQPYKYNGKELDRSNGLDWYDYGARHYDAALGRWHAVDQECEKYYGVTPYNYCYDNPVNNIDPDGKQGIPIPSPYGLPIPFYYPLSHPQSYNLPSDQQIMRHASERLTTLGQIITDTPKTSFVFGALLFYQAKNAITPEYEHQRNRERKNKEELDQNQANVAKSIDTNISGMMPNGDPAPKRNPKDGGKKTIIGISVTAAGALVDGILEIFSPTPGKDAIDAHTNVEKERIEQNKPTMWEKMINYFK